ncbi:cytochrome P450 [Tricladium varicosporioides]|nr:cytochrome P450 [Hymenoscyphus varicosporioides]
MEYLKNLTICVGLALIVAYPIITFFINLYTWRSRFHKFKAQGLPMPPHSIIWGHIPVLIGIVNNLPANSHGQYLADQLRRKYPDLGPNFYLDLYPFAFPMLVLASADTLAQVTQEQPLPKFHILKKFFYPLTEGSDILNMEGEEWKKWRGILSPGFNAGWLMGLVPKLVAETEWFCKILEEHVEKGDVFTMKPLTDNLAMDMAGHVILDKHFDCQRIPNPFVHSLTMQINWLTFGTEPNLFLRYHPLRPLIHWYHGRRVTSFVEKEVSTRFEKSKSSDFVSNRSLIDLMLKAAPSAPNGKLDPDFKKVVMVNLKLLLFAGHETTSNSACYIFYLLSTHPHTLTTLLAELRATFALAPSVPEQISANPVILNRLPYTNACIKESMRLFPVASNVRGGLPGHIVVDKENNRFETDGFMVWSCNHAIQRDRGIWGEDADEFKPERWLDAEKMAKVPKGAWRPFEAGPRNCMGQELAMMELRVIVAIFVGGAQGDGKVGESERGGWVVKDVYGDKKEMDKRRGKGWEKCVWEVLGEKGYQARLAEPNGDLPCKVLRIV